MTLRWLKDQVDGDIYLCMGEDMFLCLDRWREAEEIFASAHIICLKREDCPFEEINEKKLEFEKSFNAKITILSYDPLPVSSTEIRENIKNGKSTRGLLSDEVAEYISANDLYI